MPAAEFDRLVRETLGLRPPKSAGVLASLEFDRRYRELFKMPYLKPIVLQPMPRAKAPKAEAEAPKKAAKKASKKKKKPKASEVADGR